MEEVGGGDPVRAGAGLMKRMKVMVAVDESDGSLYALKWALDNLIATIASVGASTHDDDEGILVYLVNVQPKFQNYIYPVGPAGAAFYPAYAVAESVKKAQEERSAVILSRASQMCNDKLVKSESIILNGDPREMICQASEQMNVNLLIMGSRGLGMIKRTFLGSVSDYCAHQAKVPILIVKPPPDRGTH